MVNKKVKILYITGYGRSGSTILHNVLGQMEGFFGVGEVNRIWDLGLLKNWRCGCGVPFRECAFWNKVFLGAFGGMEAMPLSKMARLRKRTRSRHFPLFMPSFGKRIQKFFLDDSLLNLEKLYLGIQSATGCSVIIDNSKSLSYGALLTFSSKIDPYFVHTIRDPRGVTFSLMKINKLRNRIFLKRFNSVRSSVVWDIQNIFTEYLCKRSTNSYRRIFYEKFMYSPKYVIDSICELLQEKPRNIPLNEKMNVTLRATHTVTGRNRYRSGNVPLRLDAEWRERMGQINKLTVEALTWPLLRRYGYVSSRRDGKSIHSPLLRS